MTAPAAGGDSDPLAGVDAALDALVAELGTHPRVGDVRAAVRDVRARLDAAVPAGAGAAMARDGAGNDPVRELARIMWWFATFASGLRDSGSEDAAVQVERRVQRLRALAPLLNVASSGPVVDEEATSEAFLGGWEMGYEAAGNELVASAQVAARSGADLPGDPAEQLKLALLLAASEVPDKSPVPRGRFVSRAMAHVLPLLRDAAAPQVDRETLVAAFVGVTVRGPADREGFRQIGKLDEYDAERMADVTLSLQGGEEYAGTRLSRESAEEQRRRAESR